MPLKVEENCLLGTEIAPNENTNQCLLPADSKRLIRTLSLLAKHYIHVSKCAEERKSYRKLLKYIKDVYKTEKRIVINKGTQHLLNKKWGRLVNHLDKNHRRQLNTHITPKSR